MTDCLVRTLRLACLPASKGRTSGSKPVRAVRVGFATVPSCILMPSRTAKLAR